MTAFCHVCGQPMRLSRYGVYLSPIKVALLDAIAASGDIGASVADLQVLDVWRERRVTRPTPYTIRSHVFQMNQELALVGQRVISIDTRFVLVRLPSRPEAEAAE